jgi:hypothetical protein
VQVLDHCVDELGAATLQIKIFVPEYQRSIMLGRPLGGDPECPGMAKVQKAGRRGRKPPSI